MLVEGQLGEACPAAVQTLANNILTALDKAYPSFTDENHNTSWNLQIDTRGGVIQLQNHLIPSKYGIQLPIRMLDDEMKVIVQYAGELLERYCISREKHIDIEDEIQKMKINPIGQAIHES